MVSIRSGSQAPPLPGGPARRSPRSIQTVLILATQTGSSPSRAQRVLQPAAGLQQLGPLVGDDDLDVLLRSASCWPSRWTFTTILRTPWAISRSRERSIRERPATGTSGLGMVSVSGRMRSPRPAARIMAVSIMRHRPPQGGRQQAVDPDPQGRQRLVLQRTLEHPPDTRQMRQVVGFSSRLNSRMNSPMMRALRCAADRRHRRVRKAYAVQIRLPAR